MGNPTLLVGIEGIWWDGSTDCSDHRVTDGGNLLQAAPAEAGSKVQPGVSKKSGGVWGGAGS